jgi:heat shock protein HspQ
MPKAAQGHHIFTANLQKAAKRRPCRDLSSAVDSGGQKPIYRCERAAIMLKKHAKYHLGQIVRHRKHPFRGVIFDVDAMFANTDEWYNAIPEDSRPLKDQPFYHLLAENEQSFYVAYVSEQNLVADHSGEPIDHPDLDDMFGPFEDGHYPLQLQLN